MTNRYLLWLDVETTGLNPNREKLLQVAGVITDGRATKQLCEPFNYIVRHPNADDLREDADPVVQAMHDRTGLWDRLADGTSLPEIDAELRDLVLFSIPADADLHLAGNSVRLDFEFTETYLPRLASLLHYRVVDVSSIQLAFLEHDLIPHRFPKQHTHEAGDDISESIEQYRWLMESVTPHAQ